jgi:hypothetical protein
VKYSAKTKIRYITSKYADLRTKSVSRLGFAKSNINFLVVVNINLLYAFSKDVDFGFGKFSRTNLLLKQQIELGESTTSGLGYTEVRVDDAKRTHSSPEETGKVAPVPSAGVEHVWRQDAADNANNVVQVASENNSLDLQAAGGDFGDKRVADGTDRQLVAQCPDQHHGTSCERGRILVSSRDKSEEAHDEKHGAEEAETDQVEGSTANSNAHEEPSAKHTGHVDAVLSNGKVHSLARVKTSLLQEISRVAGEGVATEILNGPHHADNLGTTKIGALEAIQVAGA